MVPSFVLSERNDGVVILRLNRPEKLNALSNEMIRELSDKLKQLESDVELRVVILTAEGDRAFCAGTDTDGLSEAAAIEVSERGQKLRGQIESFPVPVIAAINGLAAGAGCELALACHLRVASSGATFSLPETKLGCIPDYGGTQRLPRKLGEGRVLEMMLTGKTITAEQAFDMGLVNRLSTSADLLTEARSLANDIAQLAPLAIRACLQAVSRGLELPLEKGLALETELFAALFATDDVREGTSAFLEKRSPKFSGR
jgi:enoyl-CoA hydratase